MGALSSVRVLDLTQFEAGPSCTEMLAWLGADVVKVEPPGRGEQGRRLGGGGAEDSWYFMLLNLNKRSITVNLKCDEGRELLLKLLPRFDVLVENYTLGTLDSFGLGWDVLSSVHPGLIYASIRGFGNSGPYASFKSFDMVGQAAGGAMSVNGERDGPPMKLGVTLGDTGTGLHCAIGILAAYIQRLATGQGQRVEVSMQESIVNFSRVAFAGRYATGRPAPRRGTASGLVPPSGLHACAGGGSNDFAYLVVFSPDMWLGVLRTIGREDLADHEDWSSVQWRSEHAEEAHGLVEAWTKTRDKFSVMEAMAANGVPCSAILDSEEVLGSAHLHERGMIATVDHPVSGPADLPGNPVRLEGSPTTITRAPLLGEDTAHVLASELGLPAEELERLAQAGVI